MNRLKQYGTELRVLLALVIGVLLGSSIAEGQVIDHSYRPLFDRGLTIVDGPTEPEARRPIEVSPARLQGPSCPGCACVGTCACNPCTCTPMVRSTVQATPRVVYSTPTVVQQTPRVVYAPQQQIYQQPTHQQSGGSALAYANALRARRGLQPFRYDPNLQASVNSKAQAQARRGRMFHPGGGFGPGAAGEGVGMSGSPQAFTSCYLYSYYPSAAAATVRGRNGRYYHCLQVSGNGAGYGPKKNSPPGRTRRVFRRRR